MNDFRIFSAGRRGLCALIARELGITHGAISQWRRVPVRRVLDVERVTGISRYELRPDIYGPPPANDPAPTTTETAA